MPTIEVSCLFGGCPGFPAADYGDPMKDGIHVGLYSETGAKVSQISRVDDGLSEQDKERKRQVMAARPVFSINRLMRWYRVTTKSPNAQEYPVDAIGNFHFRTLPDSAPWGELHFVQERVKINADLGAIVRAVAAGYLSGQEPETVDLLMLDARHALDQGRFRETVLTCWSVIDSMFNCKFDALAEKSLAGDWPDGLKFLTGNDFGLRNKMTIGMRLVGGRSFYGESEELWQKLSDSYKVRNAIIHAGALATEAQANFAVWVAQRIVKLMSEL